MGGETYSQREDFFPYLLPGARGCQRLHPLASSSEIPLISCISLAWLRLTYRVVLIMWSPSSYTPDVPECPDVLSSLFTHHSMTVCQSIRGSPGTNWKSMSYNMLSYIYIYKHTHTIPWSTNISNSIYYERFILQLQVTSIINEREFSFLSFHKKNKINKKAPHSYLRPLSHDIIMCPCLVCLSLGFWYWYQYISI